MTWFRTHEFFTAVHDSQIERLLESELAELSAEIAALHSEDLTGVCLGGGYGRGEGGVWIGADSVAHLYNDLDFFVFTDGVSRKRWKMLDRALVPIAQRWSEKLGVDVDFAPTKNRKLPETVAQMLMFQELKHGHVQIYGEGDVLSSVKAIEAGDIAPFEGVRLLMNRGMGLLLAAEKLTRTATEEEKNFIVRNLNKAVLGGGDAVLLGQRRYCWRALDRLEELKQMFEKADGTDELTGQYAAALDFKFRPNTHFETDLHLAWNQAREFWCECVQRFANVPKSESVDDMLSKLKENKTLSGGSSLRNAVRWLFRTRQLGTVRELFEAPELRVLSELYTLISIGGVNDIFEDKNLARLNKVRQNWKSFL
ncbi:MAG: hypothetical protein LBM70_01425 [Victivallales bacterium]|jgi:hypothetical protein|nr:hypothetical protein [Victivallales bacterium]